MSQNMVGKIVAVTGASSGIGEAIARRLASEGAKVVLGARRVERIDVNLKGVLYGIAAALPHFRSGCE